MKFLEVLNSPIVPIPLKQHTSIDTEKLNSFTTLESLYGYIQSVQYYKDRKKTMTNAKTTKQVTEEVDYGHGSLAMNPCCNSFEYIGKQMNTLELFKEYMKQFEMPVEPKVIFLINSHVQRTNIDTKLEKRKYSYLQSLYKEHVIFSNISDGDEILTMKDIKKHAVVESKPYMDVMYNFTHKGIYLLNLMYKSNMAKFEPSLRTTAVMFILELLKLNPKIYIILLTSSPSVKAIKSSAVNVINGGSFNCSKQTLNKTPIRQLVSMIKTNNLNPTKLNELIISYKKKNPVYVLEALSIDKGVNKFVYGPIT